MILRELLDSLGEIMLNEALDRSLITDLLSRYTWALVDRDWDAWQKSSLPMPMLTIQPLVDLLVRLLWRPKHLAA